VSERKWAERKVGFARVFARAKQMLTTDPKGSDEDDQVIDEEHARALAAEAGRLRGGLAKVAQLAAYDPGAMFGRTRGATERARAVLGGLWDRAPGVAVASITRVIEEDLGKPPQVLFAEWDPVPIAAASLGQVHAAKLHDGTDVVVKVQYPDVAPALRADLDDPEFVRKLAGAELGHSLDAQGLTTLADAVRGELDYRAEAAAQAKFAAAWAGSPSLRIPRAIDELTTQRVLVQTRARGKTIVDVAASGTPEVKRAAAGAIFAFAWGSPLAHGLLNADPNPGNFLVEQEANGHVAVWALDFGCSIDLPADVRDFDREMYWALLDDDQQRAAERFRMALANSGILRRADSLASNAHREWERALATPLATHGDFHWSARYAATFAEATQRVLTAGGLGVPASFVLLWRQRLGASAVIGMLDAHAPFRRLLVDLVGIGRKALR